MLKWINKKRNTKGFTLIELIVVIAILGILAAIAIPRFSKVQSNAKIDSDIATAETFVNAAKIYIASNNTKAADFGTVTIGALNTAGLVEQAEYKAQTNGAVMVLLVEGTDAAPTFKVTATDQILPLDADGKAAGVFKKD